MPELAVVAISAPAASNDLRALVNGVSAQLLSHGLAVAPHVTAHLLNQLNGDPATVIAVAQQLTPEQRTGQRMLPQPLPLVPLVEELFASLDLAATNFRSLLLAALCTDDRLDLVLAADDSNADEVLTGVLAQHLTITSGRFAFADDRFALWIEATASQADRAHAHELLGRVHQQLGEELQANWHIARGAIERTPAVVEILLSAARRETDSGQVERGFRLAAEAADHAVGAQADAARLVAGSAALGAGCMHEAADWLGSVFPTGAADYPTGALAPLLIAELGAHGVMPVLDPAEYRPRTDDAQQWQQWARAAGVAAIFCAERREISAMRGWLAELRDADARADAGGEIRDCAVSLCWMLSGEAESKHSAPAGAFSRCMVEALRAALDGDIDRGLQFIARARTRLDDEVDPLLAGLEHSPVVDAYLAVTEVLLLFWRGDITTALERFAAAAVQAPVGIAFAGLGPALAQRLDIAVLGTPEPLTLSLVHTLPVGNRIDGLISAGLEAYLAGETAVAAMQATLWHDRGAPEHPLALPGLDEVGPVTERSHVEPPDLAAARGLRRRIRLLPESGWRRECAEIAAAARELQSPFARARVEAMLGSVNITRGDTRAGTRFLRTACQLFDDAGADAWLAATRERLRRAHTSGEVAGHIETAPLAIIDHIDPFDASRTAWEPLLTERELEVAMRVVQGATNREIADELDVSVRTVEVHAGRVFSKLGVRKRVELTLLAHRTARHF
ncbi:response regulator transcription factor [Microbacterium sp. A94]|uniref:helix-turn-helix transcriptional regulator n=1 Tax=Microbacterium sp. A94 TaxID=3450717 RepID=UPI003F434640